MNRLTNSKKVELALKEQGRKKSWLAKELNITRAMLDNRIKDNFWSAGEIIKLKQLGII